jgi:Zn ribbon nucleic-acid-binding protein
MIGSACPRCKRDTLTLREIARIDESSLLERLFTRREVHRVVTAYLQECVSCGTRFIVSRTGIDLLEPIAKAQEQTDEQAEQRKPRPSPPAWKAPPPL